VQVVQPVPGTISHLAVPPPPYGPAEGCVWLSVQS